MRCPISLKLLSKTEQKIGYSRKGLKALTGDPKFNPMLNFDSQDFERSCPQKQKGMSISGYQPKLQLTIHDGQFDIIDSSGDFILKPSPETYPFLAENEHATMQVMKALKFNVPENGLVYFKTNENSTEKQFAFVIKRYDRQENLPIHQEQLDGAMKIGEKYGKVKGSSKQYVSYERAMKFILDNVSRQNLALRKDLFLRVVYAYLLGNNDFHLRNFSLIIARDGSISLAPVYDFISVKPYPEIFNDMLALPLLEKEEGGEILADGLETKYGCYLGMDFIELGKNIGISDKLCKKLLTDLIKQKDKIIEIYQNSFMPEEHHKQVLQWYEQRLSYLQIFNEEKL